MRRDIETDGRRAKVKFGRDWEADARRRDFTVNALYCEADGRIVDMVGARTQPEAMAMDVRLVVCQSGMALTGMTASELVPQVRAFGSFNFLLSNGEALWAHCSTKLHWLVRQHPFAQATLMDQDWTVNFAELNQPGDRAAVVVTTPLTSNEQWAAFEPNELKVFVDGLPLP